MIGVIGGRTSTQDEVYDFLATKGIVPADKDLVIYRAIMAPGETEPVPTGEPLSIRYVGGKKHDDFVLSGALDG